MSEHLQTQRYFAKQQELMNLADESREDFLARISARRRPALEADTRQSIELDDSSVEQSIPPAKKQKTRNDIECNDLASVAESQRALRANEPRLSFLKGNTRSKRKSPDQPSGLPEQAKKKARSHMLRMDPCHEQTSPVPYPPVSHPQGESSECWGPIVSEIFQSDAADSIPVQRGGRAQPPFRTNNIPSEKALLASPGNVQLSDVDVFDKGDEVRMNKASRYNSEVNDTSRVVSNKGTRVPGLNQKQQCPAAVTAAIPDGLTLLPIATTLPAEPKTITDVAAGLEFMKRSVANNASKIARAPKSVPMTAADSSVITTPASSAKSNAASTSPARNASAGASTSRTRKSTTSALVKKTKSKKEKSVLMLPCDYARKLQQMVASGEMRLYSKRYLEGKIIYYFGGDFDVATQRTREKMEFLIRHGATLLPQFDPERVTHIISDGPKATFLHSIGVKKIADIHPNIPILKWNWASRSMDNPGRMRQYQDFAAYPERVLFDPEVELQLARARNAKDRKGKGKARAPEPEVHDSESDEEYSRISEFTQDKIPNQVISDNMPRPHPERLVGGSQTSRSSDIHLNDRRLEEMNGNAPVQREDDRRSPSAAAAHRGMDDDPLAEFYTQACAELDAERYKDGEGREDNRPNGTENEKRTNVSSGVDGKFRPEEKRAAVFQCDRKRSELPVTCPNQDVIDKLSELKALHESKLGDDHKWRVYTYNKAIGFLRNHPKRITSIEEARQLRGIGEKTAQKIMEVIQTGDLRRIQYERTEDVEAVKIFTGIYGVGLQIAFQWYAAGCRTLEDISLGKGGIKVTKAQRIGLKFYEDINCRMPRQEAEDIFHLIKPVALGLDPKLDVQIMGSFRRGKADCGDVDILITRPTDDGRTHAGILRRLLAELHKRDIVTEDLCLPDDWDDLELVYRGLCHRDAQGKRRRIDFLTVPYESRGAALLYYTGDDIFNRSMRLKANKMGYSLNQKGLYAGVIRNPSDRRQKLENGYIVASTTEREIFEKLCVPWQEPHERVRH